MNRIEHLLATLAEECAEVGLAVGKALRFGLQTAGPDSLGDTNADDIARELNEVIAVAQMLMELGVLPERDSARDIEDKRQRVLGYMQFAEEIGTIKGAEDA